MLTLTLTLTLTQIVGGLPETAEGLLAELSGARLVNAAADGVGGGGGATDSWAGLVEARLQVSPNPNPNPTG